MKGRSLVKRFSGSYWKSEITRAKDRSKKFIEAAEESIRVYNAQKQVGLLDDAERRLNCWWYCVNTLLPAYYSSTPKAEVTLRKRTGGTLEEVSAIVLERNLQYQMDCAFPFDCVGYNAALQFLLTGRAVLWARYDVEFDEETVEIALFKDDSGNLVDEQGQPFTGDATKTKPGPGGVALVEITTEIKDHEASILDVVQYNDYLCSDARNETEVDWRARRAYLSLEKAKAMFGDKVADDLSYDAFPDKDKRSYDKDDDQYQGKAELWEIWSGETKRVYWMHPNSDKGIIFESEAAIEFEGFYPCTIIAQSQDPDSVLPISDFSHVRDQILEVERLTTRIHAVTQAIRTNSVYDATLGSEIEALMSGDLKMIPVTNWPSYKSRGGLAAGVETKDIVPYVNALQILQGARQTTLEQLYETLKVSDLLRGTSDQYKSATANRLENAWSSLGLIVRQNMFTKFVSDAIEKLGNIVASQFDAERLFEVGDLDRLLQPLLPEPQPEPAPEMGPDGQPVPVPPMPQPDPMLLLDNMKMQVMDFLRNDESVAYRIKIASDSMIAMDQAQEQSEGAQLMTTAGEFFNQMRALIEQYPPLLGFSIELFQNVIKRFKGGKELDGIFTKAMGQIAEIAKAREEAAKQPPPPDPVMQEMQARMQIAQIEAQARITATQMQMQDAHEKNMLLAQDAQLKMQRDQLDAQMAIQKQQFEQYVGQQELGIAQQELGHKNNELQVKVMGIHANSQSEATKQEVALENNRVKAMLDLQRLELERMASKLSETEKLLEERRLSSSQELERIKMSMEAMKMDPLKGSSQTPIVINNVIPKAAKRVGKISSDELGNTSIEIDDVRDELGG
ncbi:MAG: hypothetical protein ACRC9R_08530 [Enterovibrio sp.]